MSILWGALSRFRKRRHLEGRRAEWFDVAALSESGMATADLTLPWEELLKHGQFVRALARALVRNDDRADDVVQSAWFAVARQRPLSSNSRRTTAAS